LSYTPNWNVVFGEQPTAAKFTQLGQNDDSLHDGSGFAWGSGAILTGGPAWTPWTPAITAAGGTFTATSATGRYQQIGKLIVWKADIVITTVGSGSGAVLFTLPVTAHDSTGNIGSGREDNISGKQITAKFLNSSQASSSNYDNTSWISAASVGRLSGTYEAA
jgi:hypothetical protein